MKHVLIIGAVAALVGCASTPTPVDTARAAANLASTKGNGAAGTVTFIERAGKVYVTAEVSGLAPNREHGFHVHEKGDCSSGDGMSAGGHFNPAVSLGLWAGGRFPAAHLLPYIVAQVAGAVIAAGVLYLIASGKAGFSLAGGFASNGFGEHSPGKYSFGAAAITEVVMTFMFLIVILGATHKRAPAGFAGLAIGLALTLIHLISIPVTNTSVNPARSTGPALFVGGWALQQLWLFWVAPIAGAVAAGFVSRAVFDSSDAPEIAGR